jgi:hypothetical protein
VKLGISALRLLDFLERPSPFERKNGTAGALPRRDDDRGGRGDRCRKPRSENRARLDEKPLEILVVVRRFACGRFAVGLQNRVDLLVAGNQRVECKITNVGNRRRRGRFERQARLELLDQIAFEPVMNAVISRVLAVEVVRRVKRLMRILNVVADDGAEEDEIARPVRRAVMKAVERVPEIAERLGGTPPAAGRSASASRSRISRRPPRNRAATR